MGSYRVKVEPKWNQFFVGLHGGAKHTVGGRFIRASCADRLRIGHELDFIE